jgi:hypothetical protein
MYNDIFPYDSTLFHPCARSEYCTRILSRPMRSTCRPAVEGARRNRLAEPTRSSQVKLWLAAPGSGGEEGREEFFNAIREFGDGLGVVCGRGRNATVPIQEFDGI